MEPATTRKAGKRGELKITVPTFFTRGVALFGSVDEPLGSDSLDGDMEDGSVAHIDQIRHANFSKDSGGSEGGTSFFGAISRSNSLSIDRGTSSKESGSGDNVSGIGLFEAVRSRTPSFGVLSSRNRTNSFSLNRPESPRPGSSRAFNAISNFFTEMSESVSTPRGGHTASIDCTGPPKRLKKSPNDVTDIPETPSKENTIFTARHSGTSYSRLNNDFKIVDVIGTGSFGTVYRAQGILDGVMYAVKKSRSRPHNQSERASMMHEVHALAALSAYDDSERTSSVVRYYSAWLEDDFLCIQMELCESSACDITNFDDTCVYGLLRDILNALDVLHSNEFVHLDVKPANILVKGKRFKLGDFGLALHTIDGKFHGNVEEGDSRYMAQELLNWGPIPDLTKCDIFSLGITAFELYTGVAVEPNGSSWHIMRAGEFTLPEGTPDELASLLYELMNPEAVNRPTARACLQTYNSLKSPLELELEFQKQYARSLEDRLSCYFPYFEEDNFLGRLVQMKAHLRKQKRAYDCLEKPSAVHPVDATGNPIVSTAAQQRAITVEQHDYAAKENYC